MKRGLVAALAVYVAVLAPAAHASPRDDTATLQERLDAGGTIVLPKLSGGQCYRTRGLWVSRDDTTITSDGACIVALGKGPARGVTDNGRPVLANAVFFVSHSDVYKSQPVRVTIHGVRIVVPRKVGMHGVLVAGHELTIDHVAIGGAPVTDVQIGGGKRGSADMAERIAIRDSVLTGGQRDVVSVGGPIDLRLERNTFARAHGTRKQVSAGVHIAAVDRGQPTLDVHIVDNTITGNAGPGILLDLAPKNGAPVVASGIEISGNRVTKNRRGGIVVSGGQDDAQGTLALTNNVVKGNSGAAIRGTNVRLRVTNQGNDVTGPVQLQLAGPARSGDTEHWTPSPAQLADAGHDDTSWLQTRLDAGGGTIFLPSLSGGRCYRTRGLWVSRDDTTITSDGACIVSLGPGQVRLRSTDGDPIASSAVFFVNRSSPKSPAPVRVSISNLRIVVPDASDPMYGVAVFGHHVTLSGLDISGTPKDDVLIGARANGNGYVARVALLNSTLSGAMRNAVSAFGVMQLRIEGNTIHGVRDTPPGQPGAGIDIEPDERSQPTLGMRIVGNTIVDNAGPGVLLSLESNSGPAIIATDLDVSNNRVERNARRSTPPTLAGIAITGGQDDGAGTLALKNNVIKDNGGPGILTRALRLIVDAAGNDLGGNRG
jgi:Right handed beta helix region